MLVKSTSPSLAPEFSTPEREQVQASELRMPQEQAWTGTAFSTADLSQVH